MKTEEKTHTHTLVVVGVALIVVAAHDAVDRGVAAEIDVQTHPGE